MDRHGVLVNYIGGALPVICPERIGVSVHANNSYASEASARLSVPGVTQRCEDRLEMSLITVHRSEK